MFDYAEAKGLHILPVHYYSPVPNVGAAVDRAHNGISIDTEKSAAELNRLLKKYDAELAAIFGKPNKGPTDYDPGNSAFGPIDAGALYAMLRERRPKRIIEIGSGYSTLITAAALRANRRDDADYKPHFICIEPYLPSFLKAGVPEVSDIMETALQDVPLDLFRSLGKGDLLFIDSTHVVSFGSDVVYEYLAILPVLASGVLVHIHDIFLPSDYPQRWLKEHRFFWNEQYLLEAFLAMNPSYQIELAVHAASKILDEIPSIVGHPADVYSGSFWISRI
jgi:predicted O-methyltransferase YrrM